MFVIYFDYNPRYAHKAVNFVGCSDDDDDGGGTLWCEWVVPSKRWWIDCLKLLLDRLRERAIASQSRLRHPPFVRPPPFIILQQEPEKITPSLSTLGQLRTSLQRGHNRQSEQECRCNTIKNGSRKVCRFQQTSQQNFWTVERAHKLKHPRHTHACKHA